MAETLNIREEGSVLVAEIDAPPMNLLGPELVRDLVSADLAERYGWINRALPAAELGDFVSALAHRIAMFPAAGNAVVKDRVNAIALAPADDFRRDSDLFLHGLPEAQPRLKAALQDGSQTRRAELALGRRMAEWAQDAP